MGETTINELKTLQIKRDEILEKQKALQFTLEDLDDQQEEFEKISNGLKTQQEGCKQQCKFLETKQQELTIQLNENKAKSEKVQQQSKLLYTLQQDISRQSDDVRTKQGEMLQQMKDLNAQLNELTKKSSDLIERDDTTMNSSEQDDFEESNPLANMKLGSEWKNFAELPNTRSRYTMVRIGNDRIAIIGGIDKDEGEIQDCIDLYNLKTKVWSKTFNMEEKRHSFAAVATSDEKLYVFGGWNKNGCLSTSEMYDMTKTVNSDQLSHVLLPSMTEAKYGHSAVLYNNTKVVLMGGQNINYVSNTVEMFDIITNKWEILPSMTPRKNFAAGVSGTQIIAAGGWNNSGKIDTVEILNMKTRTWKVAANMNKKRHRLGGVVIDLWLSFQHMVVIDGSRKQSCEVYSFEDDSWSTLPMNLKCKGDFREVIAIDGMMIAGGETNLESLDLFSKQRESSPQDASTAQETQHDEAIGTAECYVETPVTPRASTTMLMETQLNEAIETALNGVQTPVSPRRSASAVLERDLQTSMSPRAPTTMLRETQHNKAIETAERDIQTPVSPRRSLLRKSYVPPAELIAVQECEGTPTSLSKKLAALPTSPSPSKGPGLVSKLKKWRVSFTDGQEGNTVSSTSEHDNDTASITSASTSTSSNPLRGLMKRRRASIR